MKKRFWLLAAAAITIGTLQLEVAGMETLLVIEPDKNQPSPHRSPIWK